MLLHIWKSRRNTACCVQMVCIEQAGLCVTVVTVEQNRKNRVETGSITRPAFPDATCFTRGKGKVCSVVNKINDFLVGAVMSSKAYLTETSIHHIYLSELCRISTSLHTSALTLNNMRHSGGSFFLFSVNRNRKDSFVEIKIKEKVLMMWKRHCAVERRVDHNPTTHNPPCAPNNPVKQ